LSQLRTTKAHGIYGFFIQFNWFLGEYLVDVMEVVLIPTNYLTVKLDSTDIFIRDIMGTYLLFSLTD